MGYLMFSRSCDSILKKCMLTFSIALFNVNFHNCVKQWKYCCSYGLDVHFDCDLLAFHNVVRNVYNGYINVNYFID